MLQLYIHLISARIRSQLQYQVSFWLDMFGLGFLTILEFATTAVLLNRFGNVGGWRLAEVGLLYGFSSISLGLAEMIARGFDHFDTMIQTGSFDGVLTRPLGSFFQILASEFQLRRLGRTFQALGVLIYALSSLPIVWNLERVLIVPITIMSGAVIFSALFVLGAASAFWTVKTPEIINIFTNGGQQLTSYPQHIFNQWLQRFFLLVVPVAFGSYPASLVLLGRSDPGGLPVWIAWLAPLVACLFLLVARGIWERGVQRYTSTGS